MMRRALFVTVVSVWTILVAEPVKVVFDTDMKTDYDDIGALAMLHALADAGECELLAVVQSSRGNAGLAVVEIVNRFYGRPDIPLGALHAGGVCHPGDPRAFNLLDRYADWYRYRDAAFAPDAVDVLRRTLAAQPDGSVVVCAVGFMTNLRRLLESPADAFSPLDGRALVARKVKRAVIMACSHPRGSEHNSRGDWKSSEITFDRWPTPIVFSDFQYGRDVYAGRAVAELPDTRNPVRDAFAYKLPPRSRVSETTYDRPAGHPSWDETAVLAAVRGFEPYFGVERGNYRMVGEKGENVWIADPKSPNCRLVVKMPKVDVGRAIDELMVRPPRPGPHVVRVAPGQSLETVRDAVRALPASNRVHGVEVVLPAGRHLRTATLELDARDGGAPGAPVVWRSDAEGRAVLCDGVELPVGAFGDVRDASAAARIDPAARPHVVCADLSKCALSWWKPLAKEIRMPMPIPELFVDGERMTPAQWPNDGDWSTIARFVDKGTQDNDGSVTQGLGNPRAREKEPPRGGVFGYAGDRPARWTKAPEVWLHGFWCFDWYDTVVPVASVCAASNTIALAAKHTYGVRPGNPSPRRWRAVHLLEELDAPGEYYVDPAAKRLYFWPPKRLEEGRTRVLLTGVWRPLLRVKGAGNLVLRGLGFEESWGDACVLADCVDVAFERCRFRNIRGKALVANGCRGCRVSTCDVFDTGTGGIQIAGGDRRTLVRGDNVVEDTLIRDFSRHCLTYASAVHLGGVGNTVRHCEISGAPHMAVGVHGNDHLFEYNVVSNVCMCSDDAAAFYKGRNPSCRGNVIRHNFWSEIGSPRGHGNAAVYFDDGDCGDMVYGDVFYRCGEPGFGGFGTVFCHGGHSNLVRNCVFVECRRPLGSAPWNQKRWEDFLKSPLEQTRLLKEVCATSAVWTARYPEIGGIFGPEADEARWNAAFDNAFVGCPAALPGRRPGETRPGIVCGRWATNATDVVFASDPGFADAAAKNFELRPDAELLRRIPAFRPIPFSKIGLVTHR